MCVSPGVRSRPGEHSLLLHFWLPGNWPPGIRGQRTKKGKTRDGHRAEEKDFTAGRNFHRGSPGPTRASVNVRRTHNSSLKIRSKHSPASPSPPAVPLFLRRHAIGEVRGSGAALATRFRKGVPGRRPYFFHRFSVCNFVPSAGLSGADECARVLATGGERRVFSSAAGDE